MVRTRISLLLLLAVAWFVLVGVSSYGVRHDIASEGFHQQDALVPGPSVTKSVTSPSTSSPIIHNTGANQSPPEDGNKEEPSDYEILLAIATSLEQWKQKKLRKKSHVHRRDEEVVCYQTVGCFRDEGPFDYLDTLPQSPEVIGTRFLLHTRAFPVGGELLRFENATTFHTSKFNASQPVKFIIHGFGSSGTWAWVKQMTESLLYVDDFNVIVVDWEHGAVLPYYVQAAANVQLVGRQLARFLELLHMEMQMDYNDVHLIGFSLGAHVAGYAGMEIKNLGRITGLDPAAPLFEGYHVNARLDITDATFVDVIHTNGDSYVWSGLGAFEPMGHVDFYPNGGKEQPGCSSMFMGTIKDIIYRNWQSLCNHRRAINIFTDSINPNCSFTGFPCDSFDKFLSGDCFHCPPGGCPIMGFYADRSPAAHGKFYSVTRDVEPFCAYQKKIELSSTKGQGSTWGKLEVVFHGQGGINETFLLSMDSQEIDDGQQIQGIVISQPEIQKANKVSIMYSKYKGWIYSGNDDWYLDRISISDASGSRYSYCGFRTPLKDRQAKTLPLTVGDCDVNSVQYRTPKWIWEVIEGPVNGAKPQPPKMVWRIAEDPHKNYN